MLADTESLNRLVRGSREMAYIQAQNGASAV